MPNNYLSVLYKHIIQVENENMGLKVGSGGTNIPWPPIKKRGGGGRHMPPLAPLPTPVIYIIYIYIYIYIYIIYI